MFLCIGNCCWRSRAEAGRPGRRMAQWPGGEMVAGDRMGMAEVVDSGYILQVKPAGIHCWTESRMPEKPRRNSHTKVSDMSTWKDGTDIYRMR